MDKLKNKDNFFFLIGIIPVMLCLFISSYARFSPFFFDTSREVYVPMAMNNGAVLYKDILNVYSPLGYQINSFVTQIFGENLDVFYILGFINSVLFLYALYLIFNIFFKENYFLKFSFLLFICASCIYAVSQANYIFPYSYSVVYALTAICFSLYFILRYINENKDIFIYLSSLFFGLSISFKYEFALFLIVLCIFLFKKSLKTKILSFVCFLIFPLTSLLILLISGCSFENIISAVKYILALPETESFKLCYKYMGLIPGINSLRVISVDFLKIFPVISVILLLFSKLFLLFFDKKFLLYLISFVFIALLTFFSLPYFVVSNSSYFDWLGIFSLAVFVVIIAFGNKTKIFEDKLFLTLYFSVLCISFKCIFVVDFSGYGTYYFPLLILLLLLSFYKFIPQFFKNNSENIKKSLIFSFSILFIFSFFVYTLSNVQRRNIAFSEKISTDKGVIYVEKSQYSAIEQTLNYLQNNTSNDDTVLILPEGALINFLSQRMSNNKFYYLIPPNIETFGEDYIVEELKNNLPDYLLFQSMPYFNFRKSYFCESFGEKICAIVPEYYSDPIILGDDFWVAVYKRKVLNENK